MSNHANEFFIISKNYQGFFKTKISNIIIKKYLNDKDNEVKFYKEFKTIKDMNHFQKVYLEKIKSRYPEFIRVKDSHNNVHLLNELQSYNQIRTLSGNSYSNDLSLENQIINNRSLKMNDRNTLKNSFQKNIVNDIQRKVPLNEKIQDKDFQRNNSKEYCEEFNDLIPDEFFSRKSDISIYTDANTENCAMVLHRNDTDQTIIKKLTVNLMNTDNNINEFMTIYFSLKYLEFHSIFDKKINIFLDHEQTFMTLNKYLEFINKYQNSSIKTKLQIKNVPKDIINEMTKLLSKFIDLKFYYIKGHSRVIGNLLADRITKEGIDQNE